MSKSSVWRIVRGAQHSEIEGGKKFAKRGQRKALTSRDLRKLNRAVLVLRRDNPNFTVMDVVKRSGIPLNKAHYRTFCREIQRLGYSFRTSRRKGILTEKDLKLRSAFAKSKIKDCSPDYWSKDVAFYLDGVSFVFKNNPMSDAVKPKTRVCRKKGEGLAISTKGSKDLAGGKRLHMIVVISYGKGVVLAESYEKMTADFFARFIRRNFPTPGKRKHVRRFL